jgi:hypothetical protein
MQDSLDLLNRSAMELLRPFPARAKVLDEIKFKSVIMTWDNKAIPIIIKVRAII